MANSQIFISITATDEDGLTAQISTNEVGSEWLKSLDTDDKLLPAKKGTWKAVSGGDFDLFATGFAGKIANFNSLDHGSVAIGAKGVGIVTQGTAPFEWEIIGVVTD